MNNDMLKTIDDDTLDGVAGGSTIAEWHAGWVSAWVGLGTDLLRGGLEAWSNFTGKAAALVGR